MRRRVAVCALAAAGLLAASDPALGLQGPGSNARGKHQKGGGNKSVNPQDLLATFIGIVRTNNGKLLRVEDVDRKILEFHATRKTEYFDGEKKIKAADIAPGRQVTIDARQFPDGELEPVIVRMSRETKKTESDSDRISVP
jgi:hypothetical protein